MASETEPIPCRTSVIGFEQGKGLISSLPYWTASVGNMGVWNHVDNALKEKIENMKITFHTGRHFVLKNLPRGTCEKDIRDLLKMFQVSSISIAPSSNSAKVFLKDPRKFDEWETDVDFILRGQKISVQVSTSEMFLCLANLPQYFTDNEFRQFLQMYGSVKRSFLMYSENTGAPKGYGFVEYERRDSALKAIKELNGKCFQGGFLSCDWLQAFRTSVRSLHSNCLRIEGLPQGYCDMVEFRRIFSTVVHPPYCQIVLKQGRPLDFGLVEFDRWQEAEATVEHLQNYQLNGSALKISYCIPGVRAINIYMKIMNEEPPVEKEALLPEPPMSTIVRQLRSLTRHNPKFARSLQEIIFQQVSQLRQAGAIKQSASSAPNSSAPSTDDWCAPSQSEFSDLLSALLLIMTTQSSGSSNILADPHLLALLRKLVLPEASDLGHVRNSRGSEKFGTAPSATFAPHFASAQDADGRSDLCSVLLDSVNSLKNILMSMKHSNDFRPLDRGGFIDEAPSSSCCSLHRDSRLNPIEKLSDFNSCTFSLPVVRSGVYSPQGVDPNGSSEHVRHQKQNGVCRGCNAVSRRDCPNRASQHPVKFSAKRKRQA